MFIFAWTPLIDSTLFDGMRTDVTALGTGVISVAAIVLGIFFIVKAMR